MRGKLALGTLIVAGVLFAVMVLQLRGVGEAAGLLPQSAPGRTGAQMAAFREALTETGLTGHYRLMLRLDFAFMAFFGLGVGLALGRLWGWGLAAFVVAVDAWENLGLLAFLDGGLAPDPMVSTAKFAFYAVAGLVLAGTGVRAYLHQRRG
ncbi:hypothetical protein [Sagittula salina]|uniref:Uncharacterized protein n=1 Tax=Sagittula salina TaxID=2820268 RepID=A0A940S205_9RHOB|nr:hypothetical protein [Sagittula salina]MBP0483617.1 hypothetical protein [Sagittula salina]